VTLTTKDHENEAKGGTKETDAADHAKDHARILELVKTQYGGLLSLVRRKLKDRELAADLINEAIAVTLEHSRQGRLNQQGNIGGYVFKVTMNLLRNHRRNSDNREDLRSDTAVLDTHGTYEPDAVEAAQTRLKTQQLIASLSSPRDREVIKRFYLDEEGKQRICEDMGLTPLQFTQVISRARQRMKAVFDAQGFKRSDFLSLVL